MKLGTATSVLYLYKIKDAVQVAAKAGFDGVDIWGGRPHVYRNDYSDQELKDLRKFISNLGMSVASFMPAFYRYPHSLSNPNPRVREDSIEYMRQCIDNAAELGTRVVLVVPDLSLYGESKQDSLGRMIESVDEVARYASQYDLKLGIEVLYYDETDFVNNSDDALYIINQLDHKNIGVVLDTGTLNLSNESPDEIFSKLNDYILQVHVNDNHGVSHQQNLIPGDGTFDFRGLIGVLKKYGFQGFLSAELSKEYATDAERALRTTAERMRSWIQEVQP